VQHVKIEVGQHASTCAIYDELRNAFAHCGEVSVSAGLAPLLEHNREKGSCCELPESRVAADATLAHVQG